MEFYPAEFSLPSFLEETIDLFRTRAQGKGIAFPYANRYRLVDRHSYRRSTNLDYLRTSS